MGSLYPWRTTRCKRAYFDFASERTSCYNEPASLGEVTTYAMSRRPFRIEIRKLLFWRSQFTRPRCRYHKTCVEFLPQQPTVFSGSVRSNMGPLKYFLMNLHALEIVGMFDFVQWLIAERSSKHLLGLACLVLLKPSLNLFGCIDSDLDQNAKVSAQVALESLRTCATIATTNSARAPPFCFKPVFVDLSHARALIVNCF